MIRRFKNLVRKIVFKFITPPPMLNSYSQAGEDVVMDFLFKGIGKPKPVYLELGTNSPIISNNTYMFYQRGARGVLVEADESIVPHIKQVRPGDKLLNIGVGLNNEKEADFYIFDINGLNTFNKEEAEYRQKNGTSKLVKVTKVQLKTINEIIRENFDTWPDLLSIDIEGLDLSVLKTLDFERYPIPVICAETCTYSENHIKPKDASIAEFVISK